MRRPRRAAGSAARGSLRRALSSSKRPSRMCPSCRHSRLLPPRNEARRLFQCALGRVCQAAPMAPDPAPVPPRGRLQRLSPAQRGLLGGLGLIVAAAAIAWGVLSLTGALDHPEVEVADVLDAGT